MAETPIFESEKTMKKQHGKRTLTVILAAALLLLAVAAAVLFAVKCSGGSHSGGSDLPFRYTWREAADGSALLNVSREGSEGLVWRVTDDGSGFGTVGVTPSGGRRDSEFRLKPIAEGRSLITLTLGNGQDEKADSYAMELLTEAYREDGKLRCRVLNASCRKLQNTIEVTEGDLVYSIYKDSGGDMILEIKNPRTDWECVSSNEDVAAVIGVIFADDCVRAYLRAGKATGTSEVSLKSLDDGKELKVMFTRGEDGVLLASGASTATFEPDASPIPDPTEVVVPDWMNEDYPVNSGIIPMPTIGVTEEAPAETPSGTQNP